MKHFHVQFMFWPLLKVVSVQYINFCQKKNHIELNGMETNLYKFAVFTEIMKKVSLRIYIVFKDLCRIVHKTHRSDSIQGTDYITTPIQEFLEQKLKIENDKSVEILFH